MIAIIDYGMGNLSSIRNAFAYLGQDVVITRDRNEILNAERLILPGVGSYRKAMENIDKMGMYDIIKSHAQKGKPILGICLGMQLMALASNEDSGDGETEGFGFLPFHVQRFQEHDRLSVPHIGFNEVEIGEGGKGMFESIDDNSDFYFVHSFRIVSDDVRYIAGITEYDGKFVSAFIRGNIWGTQFHPEKSQSNGLKLLQNFVKVGW